MHGRFLYYHQKSCSRYRGLLQPFFHKFLCETNCFFFWVCVCHWIKAVIVWHRPLNVDRFGVSVVANIPLDEEADATSNAAVGIARAFHFIASDKDPRQALDWLLQVTQPFQICYVLVHLKQEAWFFPKDAFCERFQTRGLFLESPETFQAYFWWHNSLYICPPPVELSDQLGAGHYVSLWWLA